jgi:hypothetical protein
VYFLSQGNQEKPGGLLTAHFGKEGVPVTLVPKISGETIAEMIGTRSRVSFFMNQFRRLGFAFERGSARLSSNKSRPVVELPASVQF